MEQLLEVDNLEDALAGSLEIIVETLNSEAGAIWLLDAKTDRLSPLFHMGPADVSGITVENGLGIEGIVTKTGRSVIVEDAACTCPRSFSERRSRCCSPRSSTRSRCARLKT